MSGIDPSMFELFREEVKAHADTLGNGLVALDARPGDAGLLEELMRAAHSIKGAARIVGIDTAVRLAHVLEDALVAAQEGKIRLGSADIDLLLRGSDVLAGLATLTPDTTTAWEQQNLAAVEGLEPLLAALAKGESTPAATGAPPPLKGRAEEQTSDVRRESDVRSGPTPPPPRPAGRGEEEPSGPTETFPAREDLVSPLPAGSGAGGVGSPPPFALPDIPVAPFALRPDHSMLDLFREEAREHLGTIVKVLPHLSADPTAAEPALEALKQLRGAARLVKCAPVIDAAGTLAAFIRATRDAKAPVAGPALDWLRYAVATLAGVLSTDDDSFADWLEVATPALASAAAALEQLKGEPSTSVTRRASDARSGPPPSPDRAPPPLKGRGESEPAAPDREPAPSSSPPLPFSGGGARSGDGGGSLRASDAQPSSESPTSLPTEEPPVPDRTPLPARFVKAAPAAKEEPVAAPAAPAAAPEPVVRVSAQSLNRLMGLAGESLVQARWLPSFSTALLKLKKQQDRMAAVLDTAYHAATNGLPAEQIAHLIADTRRQWAACRQELIDKTGAFDDHAARAEDLNARLYREVIISRMRPFGDGLHGLPRMVRDMARSLGKEARLVVVGEHTEVDRDILEKLESPLSHLIRNAIDHGLETPDLRGVAEKPAAGTITVEARHRAGMLLVTVSDDGRGVDLDRLRKKVVERGLNSADMTAKMTEAELLEFLFLPGFSTAPSVTEFSGRGVGLDVVMDTIRKVGGNVRISTTRGRGTTFHLQLPLTLSVIRAVVIDVAGEPYAFPHTRIDRLIRVRRDEVRSLEHRQFVTVDGQNVGLVMAAQLLDMPAPSPTGVDVPVVLLSDGAGTYGLVVDAFRGEQDLVVRPLDPRLGKVPNLSAAAILDDGAPVLIVDVEDLLRSMDQFIQTGSLVRCETKPTGFGHKKRVLVVDDSITVREVERQLLLHKGYDVAVAVDGMDGWNKVRAGRWDLLVSDIDMPRMNGLQLVQAVRADDRLRDLPVIIVSYKEREEDRIKGLEVGANAYLTKSSFHDNRFMEAVVDLIGPADGP